MSLVLLNYTSSSGGRKAGKSQLIYSSLIGGPTFFLRSVSRGFQREKSWDPRARRFHSSHFVMWEFPKPGPTPRRDPHSKQLSHQKEETDQSSSSKRKRSRSAWRSRRSTIVRRKR